MVYEGKIKICVWCFLSFDEVIELGNYEGGINIKSYEITSILYGSIVT
jgi:hypothetical protein